MTETSRSESTDIHVSPDVTLPDVCQSGIPSATSSGSSVCRICQLGRRETDKELVDIGCQCKGTLSMCHRECLVEWANAQQSAVCEICQTEYPGIVARPFVRTPRHRRQRRTIRDVFGQCETRRLWFVLICLLLFVATLASAALLHYVQTDYLNAYSENIARSPVVQANYNFCFGLILSLFIFCLVLLLAVLVLWFISECFIWPQQRRARRGHRFQMTEERRRQQERNQEGLRPRLSRSYVVHASTSLIAEQDIVARTRTSSL